ncbi:two component transcriptional regulator, LytTR family [Pseudonocardia thermophila]|uniref:Two component transcriptional regulator, LytTR family n=1 Tax=Pseudonocardia thermophila TaxID=1848 RepID=A0A1M6NM01_PSETH|nr:LytTR family DNA-binding domain-containing protein [Pseudonocardia thermophila]SHJ96777.1 two component transcriptional regulator, LytTR family [Pseudonocardia thermophila]
MIAAALDGHETAVRTSAGIDGLTVLAVDDERPALDDLVHLLSADPHVGTVLSASNGADALRILTADPRRTGCAARVVDAVFLDIRMPGIDGLELARLCTALPSPPMVVFVTAHEDKAVAAFEVGAVDYLLKPLHSARLATTLDRIAAVRAASTTPPAEEVLPVELGGTTRLVPRSKVRWVEAQGDYVRLHTDGESHLVRMPLGELEERWRGAGFLRVHRSFLVARNRIRALRRNNPGHVVQVATGGEPPEVELPVSRRHLAAVRAELRGDWSGLT